MYMYVYAGYVTLCFQVLSRAPRSVPAPLYLYLFIQRDPVSIKGTGCTRHCSLLVGRVVWVGVLCCERVLADGVLPHCAVPVVYNSTP